MQACRRENEPLQHGSYPRQGSYATENGGAIEETANLGLISVSYAQFLMPQPVNVKIDQPVTMMDRPNRPISDLIFTLSAPQMRLIVHLFD